MFFTSIHLTKCQIPLTFVRNLSRTRNIKKIKSNIQCKSLMVINSNNNKLKDLYEKIINNIKNKIKIININYYETKNKITNSLKNCSKFVKTFIESLKYKMEQEMEQEITNTKSKSTRISYTSLDGKKIIYNVNPSYKVNGNIVKYSFAREFIISLIMSLMEFFIFIFSLSYIIIIAVSAVFLSMYIIHKIYQIYCYLFTDEKW